MTKNSDDAAREHIQDFAQQWFGQIVDDDKPWTTGRIKVQRQAAKLSGHALDSMIAVLIMEARKGTLTQMPFYVSSPPIVLTRGGRCIHTSRATFCFFSRRGSMRDQGSEAVALMLTFIVIDLLPLL